MSGVDLRAEFAKRGPWVTQYRIAGEPYGGEFEATSDLRLTQFWQAFPQARTILELGSIVRKRGFGDIDIVQDIQSHPHGPIITLSASRRGAGAPGP